MFEIELASLKDQGINLSALAEDYDIVIFPENTEDAETAEELIDADDAMSLAKHLKQSGARCGTALDIGIDCPTFERRSNDLWIGLVWIFRDAAWPFLVSVFANRFTDRGKGIFSRGKGQVYAKFRWAKDGKLEHLDWQGDGATLTEVLKVIQKSSEKDST